MSTDIVERLEEESVRLSGHSLDRGSADAGIAANVAAEAAETITSLRSRLAQIGEILSAVSMPNRDAIVARLQVIAIIERTLGEKL